MVCGPGGEMRLIAATHANKRTDQRGRANVALPDLSGRNLGRRLAGSAGILMRMRESVDLLSNPDIEDVAGTAAEQVRAALTGLRNQRALRRRRQESRDDVA